MPVPATINDLSKTAGSNFPQGTDSPSSLDDAQRAHGSFIAQLRDGDHVTAATAKTTLVDADFFPMNDSAASSILKKITWANIKAALAGLYQPVGSYAASGSNSDITALLNASGVRVATRTDVASAATVVLTSVPDDIQITGTTAITGFTVPVGRVLRVRFAAASLTLTNNANIVTQTGANIVTQAGDTCIFRATAANVVEVLSYVPAKNASQPGAAPVYGARAWCVFNGTTAGTNAPIAGGNVTSVTRNAAGDYTINFATAMPDANYSVLGAVQPPSAAQYVTSLAVVSGTAPTTASVRVGAVGGGGASYVLNDSALISVAIFR